MLEFFDFRVSDSNRALAMFGFTAASILRNIWRSGLVATQSQSFVNSSLKPSLLGFARFKHEYAPRFKKLRKAFKGRVSVSTGGSIKGKTLEFGEYGLRLKSNGVRMTAKQLQEADKVIRREIRPSGATLVTRFVCNTPVCIKGNQTRMGKGKGSFSHFACRVKTGKVLFEIMGDVHEKVAKESLRKASDKLPGVFEIIDRSAQIRISPTHCIDRPETVDYVEKLLKNPTKKWANIQLSKEDVYRLYRGR